MSALTRLRGRRYLAPQVERVTNASTGFWSPGAWSTTNAGGTWTHAARASLGPTPMTVFLPPRSARASARAAAILPANQRQRSALPR